MVVYFGVLRNATDHILLSLILSHEGVKNACPLQLPSHVLPSVCLLDRSSLSILAVQDKKGSSTVVSLSWVQEKLTGLFKVNCSQHIYDFTVTIVTTLVCYLDTVVQRDQYDLSYIAR